MKKVKILLRVIIICFALFVIIYPIAVYSDIPFIKKWRDIYIETAMTTMNHQWLATAFIPKAVIDDVMSANEANKIEQQNFKVVWENATLAKQEDNNSYSGNVQSDGIDTNSGDFKISGDTELSNDTNLSGDTELEDVEEIDDDYVDKSSFENTKSIFKFPEIEDEEDDFYFKFWELDTEEFRSFLSSNPEFLQNGYDNLLIENYDYQYDIKSMMGERIYLLDSKNNLIIFEVKGSSYVGKLATVKDPTQVRLAKSKTLGNYGTLLREFYTQENALLTINCSGFKDVDFKGNGGIVTGSFILDGEEIGNPKDSYFIFGQKKNYAFFIEKLNECDKTQYRWAAQFGPALVINGEKKVKGTYGYGIQPRTAIGQTLNGEMLLLIIDGRQIGYSLGATVSDCADILLQHNAYQAINSDGGSSSLMWYKGKNITKPSSTNYLGRYLPNALVVDYAKS